MAEPRAAAVPKPCCVCDAPGGKHCTKCKSRHYCSKQCQLVDWKRGHNKACKQLAAAFQDRLLDEIMPAKLKIKEEPAIVEYVAPAAGSTAARTGCSHGQGGRGWRAEQRLDGLARRVRHLPRPTFDRRRWPAHVLLVLLQVAVHGLRRQVPAARRALPALPRASPRADAEIVRRLQKHADEGRAEAQVQLGTYGEGTCGVTKSFQRAL
jgi:hypothetical protein